MRHYSFRRRFAAVSYDQLVDKAVDYINEGVATKQFTTRKLRSDDFRIWKVLIPFVTKVIQYSGGLQQFLDQNPEFLERLRDLRFLWSFQHGKEPVFDPDRRELLFGIAKLVNQDIELDLPKKEGIPETIPPQKKLSLGQFWQYLEALKGNAKRALVVVPAEYWRSFANSFGDLHYKLRQVMDELEPDFASDDARDYLASAVIRQGRNFYDDLTQEILDAADSEDWDRQKAVIKQITRLNSVVGERFMYPISSLDELVAGTMTAGDVEDMWG